MHAAVMTATLVLAVTGTAAAQPGITPPVGSPAGAPAEPPAGSPAAPPTWQPAAPLSPAAPLPPPALHGEMLSESTALLLSVGGTVASWAMFMAASSSSDGGAGAAETIGAFGTLLAPTFGHWYAGSIVTRGLGVRVLGVGSAFTGALYAFSHCGWEGEGDCDEADLGAALLIAGAALYIAGTVDDIATVSGKVRRHNNRMLGIAVVPTLRSDSGGFAIAGRF